MAVKATDETPLYKRLDPDFKDSIHGPLITALRTMIQKSERFIDQRKGTWDVVDHHNRMYLNLNADARAGDWSTITGKKEMPWKRSIVIPLSYSARMSRAAIMYQFFMASDPFAHVVGVEGSDDEGAGYLESMLAYDARMSRNELMVWQMINDGERYGLSVWHDTWEEKYGWVTSPSKVPASMKDALPEQFQHFAEPTEEWNLMREWNNWRSLDPRQLLPDPTVSLSATQSGSYIGHWEMVNWIDLRGAMLIEENGPYFNVARARSVGRQDLEQQEQGGKDVTGQYEQALDAPFDKYPNIRVQHMYWKLIPKDWELSDKEYPEIWQFAVAEKRVIIRAHPLPYRHQEFPYAVGTPEYDQHAAFVPGMQEQLIGIQDVSTWFVNAHVVNTRKVLHDRTVVNDELIRIDDFLSPNPAQQVRLTKEGKRLHKRGMSIGSMYEQLKISDITRGHLESAMHLLQWSQRMSGTSDPIQAMPLPQKRTLGEIQEVKSQGTLLIDTPAQLLDQQVVRPVIERAIQNRQQHTSMRQAYRILGERAMVQGGAGQVLGRDDIAGQYDYVARTKSMAEDPARNFQMWVGFLSMLGSNPILLSPNPETGEMINVHEVFKEAAKVGGVNYLERFFMQAPPMMGGPGEVGVVPDEELAAQEAAGNVLPMGQVGGV